MGMRLNCVLLLGAAIAGCEQATSEQVPPVTGPGSGVSSNDAASTEPGDETMEFKSFLDHAPDEAEKEASAPQIEFPRFTDTASDSGIEHVYDNGASGQHLMVEATGGGCGWVDYDGDGWMDLYLTQGGRANAPPDEPRPPDRLFRQVAPGRFVDITSQAGIDERKYGQGIAVGDFNNDGFDDLYVTNVGRNSLLQNMGDGTYRDVTEKIGVGGSVWSSSAAWGDIDRDGDLDLYVCNYTQYDPYDPLPCPDDEGNPAICHPRHVEPEPDEFYENLGNGRFRPASRAFGLYGPGNKALGVAIADFTGDDWPDIYVANDTEFNFLFVNREGKRFEEKGAVLGAHADGREGAKQASMGVAVADYDRNGYLDLCLTHFTGEQDTLYRNLGPSGMHDVSSLTRLYELTFPKLGFGIVMRDFNHDGRMDMFVANGHIDPQHPDGEGYEQRPQLLSFDGRPQGRWWDGGDQAGDFFQKQLVGRGVATADYDRDGDLDLAVVNQNDPTALLRNDSRNGHWLQLRLIGIESNRRGIGTQVHIRYGDQQQFDELAGGTSYAATHEPLLAFGLGEWSGPVECEVRWPSGRVQKFTVERPDGLVTVIEDDSWDMERGRPSGSPSEA